MAFTGFSKGGNFGSYINGLARLKTKGDDVRIKFKDGKVLEFKENLLPEFPKTFRSGDFEYYVSLTVEKDAQGEPTSKVEEIKSIRPARWDNELFLVVDVTRDPESNIPTFYEKQSKFNEDDTKKMVNWFLEFQEGEFKGVLVPFNVHYRFQNNGEGQAIWDFTEYAYNMPQATRIHHCVEWYVEIHNVLSDVRPIQWPDDGNIVPELLARILDNKVYLRASGKDGWTINDTLHAVKVQETKAPTEEAEEAPEEDSWDEEDW